MNDSYGSVHRQIMKSILKEPAGQWRPTNRRRGDCYERVLCWASFGLAIVILVLAGVELSFHLWRHFHHG